MSEFVRLEVEDGVATLRLDRPKMNALDVQVQEEIRAAAREATDRDDVRAVVLYGGERLFAAARTSRRWPTCRTPTWSSAPAT